MVEPVQPSQPVVQPPTADPTPKLPRHLGLITILVVLSAAVAALVYVSIKPTTTSDLQGNSTAATDNQSLGNDLNNVNSTLTQGDQDLNSSDSALGDQQPTITQN